MLLTSRVRADALPPDDVLRLTPGIFQPLVEKRHELRVTVMGERVISARLLSQADARTQLDWRARSVDLAVEPDTLPATVERSVRELMRRLGLVFGCLDFIVTPEGRHVFLEVNPMGQFLWIEQLAPEIRLLGPFCDLLLARGRPDVAMGSNYTGDVEVRSEAAYYGPSYMIDYLWNDYKGLEIETVLINCHYPITPNSFRLQWGAIVKKLPGVDDVHADKIAAKFARGIGAHLAVL